MAMADVTVRGAGIFGLSIAWVCTLRGAKVRVIDPGGVGAGASGGLVGALAPHVPENWNPKKAFQLESLVMAADFWARAEAASGLGSGYARTGRLQPVADQRALDLARARCRTAAELWPAPMKWEVVRATGGWQPVSPTGWLIRDSLSARLHPRQACAALAGALAARGVEVANEAPEEGAVVHATGLAGLVELGSSLGRQVGSAVKGQAALLDCDARALPQVFGDGVHIVPHGDGTVAVGSTSEREFDDPTATDNLLDQVIKRARALVPAVRDAAVIARWAGLRPRATSRAPVAGPWPGRSGHFVANGGFKIGFGMAPKLAETLADLVLEGRDGIPPDFHPRALL